MPPIEEAFRAGFPEAQLRTTLDETLIRDVPDGGPLPGWLIERMLRLVDFVLVDDIDGLLVACSMYGAVIDDLIATRRMTVPVLKADQALYGDVAARGMGRVGLVLTLEAAVRPALDALAQACGLAGVATPEVDVRCLPERRGEQPEGWTIDDVVNAAGCLLESGAEAIILGQYSLTPASEPVHRATGLRVLSGPASAAAAMRTLALGDASGKADGPLVPSSQG
jgi:Asp/Glu/hydantoin racemase